MLSAVSTGDGHNPGKAVLQVGTGKQPLHNTWPLEYIGYPTTFPIGK